MIDDMLTMKDVVVVQHVETITDGESSIAKVSYSLPTAFIYPISVGGRHDAYIDQMIQRGSTHILVTKPGYHAWARDDLEVTHGGRSYKVVGRAENVMEYDEMTVVGLELKE
jgi:hypothetical protein